MPRWRAAQILTRAQTTAFVFCLGGVRALLYFITAFTPGHSQSYPGVVQNPTAPIEVGQVPVAGVLLIDLGAWHCRSSVAVSQVFLNVIGAVCFFRALERVVRV